MKHPVIAIVLAVALALAAAVAVYAYAAGAGARALASQQPATVMVATSAIPAGTGLQAAFDSGLLAPDDVAGELLPSGALTSVDQGNGSQVAVADIPAGRLVMAADFGSAVPQVEALDVPDGMLAVTVALEDPAKVGSFLRPGAHVAVFDTFIQPGADPLAQEPVKATRALLPDVLVLAVGSTPENAEATAEADAWSAPLVTVAVDQASAERLVHASRTGQLYLALLGGDTQVAVTAGIDDARLFSRTSQ